ncbi:MAG: methyltransferase domain-containing protein [Prevotellaceae bacterium]|jgi:23S rRNA (guanine745-N1)-methyltransferase|nr:methyltransferase domain-containing protein [Prevotellaceae bacterium]
MIRREGLLQCPICNGNFEKQEKYLICSNSHCFDIAKTGYVNFCGKQEKGVYDKELFRARAAVTKGGFFSCLEKQVGSLIGLKTGENKKVVVLDAGCGDGTLFSRIIKSYQKKDEITGIGFDLSKEGILLASKNSKKACWLVADISNIPLKDSSTDIILNILSPANYKEFNRVLKKDGVIIKVIPNKDYLKELRVLFSKKEYSNADIVQLFKENVSWEQELKVVEEVRIDKSGEMDFVKMTPLAKNANLNNEKVKGIEKLTVDFTILVGCKSDNR